MDLNINVNGCIGVEVSLSPEAVAAICGRLAPARKQTTKTTQQPTPQPASQPTTQPAPQPAQPSQPAAPAAPAAPEPAADYAAAVKEVMNRTRCRIIGEDWARDTTTEAYRKHYATLNRMFKAEAQRLGVEKPTAIADEMLYRQFCESCALMDIDADGNLVVDNSLANVLEKCDPLSELPF